MSQRDLKAFCNFLGVLLRLSRIDSCLLTFLAVLLPIIYHTGSVLSGLAFASPILPVTMCGFILNDINDIEKDYVNHPSRPLPKKQMRITTSVATYFFLLSVALILIKWNLRGVSAFYYIVFLIGFTNYNYIVSHFAYLKTFYVAIVGTIPILITIECGHLDAVYYYVAISFTFFILGREILMDALDSGGDSDSLALRIGALKSARWAFGIQLFGLLWLIPLCGSSLKLVLLLGMTVLTLIFGMQWNGERKRRAIIMAMKLQMLLGLLFLA